MLYMVIERFRERAAPTTRHSSLRGRTPGKDLVEFEIVPVRTSAEAVQVIAPRL